MGAVVAVHPEDVLHGVEVHVPDVNVLDVGAAAGAGLDPDAGLGVDGVDAVGSDVLDAAGHLAAEGDDGAVGGDAGEALDAEVLSWLAVLDAVLVPPALHGDAVVAGDHVRITYACVYA